MKKPRIVVLGGGTGSFAALSGLKTYPVELSAIVTMSDDGGSTGVLRDELGVLPPGDVRRCLVALSDSPEFLRKLMNYRFGNGGLAGHAFGNIFLSALEKMTGSFDRAVEMAGEVLRIKGRVIPVTLGKTHLVARFPRGRVMHGEHRIDVSDLNGMRDITLEPRAQANPKAVAAIRAADAIVVGPGDVYTSLIPNLLVRGIPEAIQKSRAVKIYNCNLMTRGIHTPQFTVADFVRKVEEHLGTRFDCVTYNTRKPDAVLLRRYARHGDRFVLPGKLPPGRQYVAADLLSRRAEKISKHDPIPQVRSLIRHDSARLGRVLMRIIRRGRR